MDESCLLEFNNDFNNEDNMSDLHAYYMAQFNLELESGASKKTVDFDGNLRTDWFVEAEYNKTVSTDITVENEFKIETTLNANSESDVIENIMQNEKLAFDEETSDYIDDEQLIMEELCKVDDNVSCRLSPDMFTEEFLSAITKDQNILPPIEKAFSKHYCNYTSRDASIPQSGSIICNNLDISTQFVETNLTINNLDSYSYPNNILNNLSCDTNYVLPDTPTSSTEFSYDDADRRKVSICESLESDIQSIDYFEEGVSFEEDEMFMNLDDLGLHFENDEADDSMAHKRSKDKFEKEKYFGDRICLWESCFEKYPSQNTLVEHIERSHVNTYKGEEFCCLWSECARNRRPFNARYKLLIHMRVHSGHKPNRCNHPGCGKAFSRLENLKIHVRSHTGERPYACPAPHCRKAFSNSSDRAKHQRTHFNARPYACGAVGCGKRYTDPSSLRKHVKTHPHDHAFTHMHVYTPPPRADKMAAKMADKMAERANMAPHSPVKLHTIRSIRNKLAPELLLRGKMY